MLQSCRALNSPAKSFGSEPNFPSPNFPQINQGTWGDKPSSNCNGQEPLALDSFLLVMRDTNDPFVQNSQGLRVYTLENGFTCLKKEIIFQYIHFWVPAVNFPGV